MDIINLIITIIMAGTASILFCLIIYKITKIHESRNKMSDDEIHAFFQERIINGKNGNLE